MAKLKYEGEGIICQFGEYADGWTGEVSEEISVALLRVPGFKEVKPATKKEKEKKEGK